MIYTANDCSTIRDVPFWFRAVYELRSPSMHCSLFPGHNFVPTYMLSIHHLCIPTCKATKLDRLHMNDLYILKHYSAFGDILVWFRAARQVWLESYSPRCTSQSFPDTTWSAYTVSLYIHSNYAWQQNSHSFWLYCTPNNGFPANHALFLSKQNAQSWLTSCCSP